MACDVPFPRWGEMFRPEILRDKMVLAGIEESIAGPLADVLGDVFMVAAREEEANYEYLCGLIDDAGGTPA